MLGRTTTKAIGLSLGFCALAVGGGYVVNQEIQSAVWGERPIRAVSANEANDLCSDYLGGVCDSAQMRFVKGDFRKGWLDGGKTTTVFEIDSAEREQAVRAFTELSGYDVDLRAVRQDGKSIFLKRRGENQLELVFTDS